MKINTRLTDNVEIGAVRVDNQDGLEVVTKDNLRTVRNLRVETEPRMWEVALPTIDESGSRADYDSVRQLWIDSERGLHTFDFKCFVDDVIYEVRFASPLQIVADAGHLRKIATFTLVEDDG